MNRRVWILIPLLVVDSRDILQIDFRRLCETERNDTRRRENRWIRRIKRIRCTHYARLLEQELRNEADKVRSDEKFPVTKGMSIKDSTLQPSSPRDLQQCSILVITSKINSRERHDPIDKHFSREQKSISRSKTRRNRDECTNRLRKRGHRPQGTQRTDNDS